eukprot:gene13649-28991_t
MDELILSQEALKCINELYGIVENSGQSQQESVELEGKNRPLNYVMEEGNSGSGDDLEISLENIKGYTLQISIAEEDWNKERKSLFATYLWSGSRILSEHLVENHSSNIDLKSILEFGAGVGIPSIICNKIGAAVTCVSDYPAEKVIDNLRQNIQRNCRNNSADNVVVHVVPYIWGEDTSSLLKANNDSLYDIALASECLWNHAQHEALLLSIKNILKPKGLLIVSFSHHIPGLEMNDLNFFTIATEMGFDVINIFNKIGKHMWNGQDVP